MNVIVNQPEDKIIFKNLTLTKEFERYLSLLNKSERKAMIPQGPHTRSVISYRI